MEMIPSYSTIKDFIFESGEILEELEVEYYTMGTPRTDDDDKIVNGLLFLHGWSGDYGSFKRFYDFTNPEEVFDAREYFIISPTALGSPGTAAPSTSRLGKDFPHYTVGDMVNVQYRLLNDILEIRHLNGIFGTSMGGFQSLMWSLMYPNFMDSVINLVTGPAVVGRNQAIFQLNNNLIEDHPAYRGGDYQNNPIDALKNANQLMFLFAFSIPYYHSEFPEKQTLLDALNEQGMEGMQMDARDIVWRNNAALSFDIREQLDKIEVKSLIIGIEGDEYFPPEIEAVLLSESLQNSDLLIYKSKLGHLGINEIEKMKDALIRFFK
jgi:homoserine O-acetyltransferase/O-succinyltransferase